MTITLTTLNSLWPEGDRDIAGLRQGIVTAAPAVFAKYGITSNLVIAHIMAQVSHECGAGLEVVENLNYSANRLMQVWPSRFPDIASATPYANNSRALANKVYNGRMGNQIGTDDGWNFRGRGATQTTGREGYSLLGSKLGLDLISNPMLINDPMIFIEAGVADFIICGCLVYAQNDDLTGVTKRLNGGIIGLDQRGEWLTKWKTALANTTQPLPLPPIPEVHPPLAPPPVAKQPPISESPVSKAVAVVLALLKSLFKRS